MLIFFVKCFCLHILKWSHIFAFLFCELMSIDFLILCQPYSPCIHSIWLSCIILFSYITGFNLIIIFKGCLCLCSWRILVCGFVLFSCKIFIWFLYKEGSVPSFSIFWKSSCRIGISSWHVCWNSPLNLCGVLWKVLKFGIQFLNC